MRVISPSTRPVTLRCNCKIADVSPCVALEDFDTDYFYLTDSSEEVKCTVTKTADRADTASEKSLTVDSECTVRPTLSPTLSDLGLQDTTHLSPL